MTQFANTLKRAVRYIPEVRDKELIIWFLNGLRPGIAHYCKCDTKGQPWQRYQELIDHARAKEAELNSRKGMHVDTKGKPAPGRFVKTWTKTGGKANASLAVANTSPQAKKGPWKDAGSGRASKLARVTSPSPVRGGGGGASGSGGGGSESGGHKGRDWDLDFPGEPNEPSKFEWLSTAQAKFCGKQGLCFYCFKPRNDCPSQNTCAGRKEKMNIEDIRRDAPKWERKP